MLVSICIPTCNRARHLANCLRSLERSGATPGVDFEIRVSDNGSTDDAQEVVRAAQHRGRLETELLEATARRLQERFRANPDPAWLAGLVDTSDPVERVDTRGTAALRGLS